MNFLQCTGDKQYIKWHVSHIVEGCYCYEDHSCIGWENMAFEYFLNCTLLHWFVKVTGVIHDGRKCYPRLILSSTATAHIHSRAQAQDTLNQRVFARHRCISPVQCLWSPSSPPPSSMMNDLCIQRTLRSARVSAQSDQSLRCPKILGAYTHSILLVLSCCGSNIIWIWKPYTFSLQCKSYYFLSECTFYKK